MTLACRFHEIPWLLKGESMTTETETTRTVIEPMADGLLVKPDDAAATTKGGIVLPDQAKEKPAQGEIVAIGPGRTLDNGEIQPVAASVGDKVIFSKYAGTDLKVNGVDMILLRESDVLAKVREESS
jgi:chaperonin GroES